jgi:hypothetical protein
MGAHGWAKTVHQQTASSHRPRASYQGVHSLAFSALCLLSEASPILPFATLPVCLPAYLARRDHRCHSPLDCYYLLCCVLLLQEQVLAAPFLCFFSSVSHPLSLNLTRFSPLLFAINFFLSWGLGRLGLQQ